MQVECIDREVDFLNFRKPWEDLWRRSAQPSLFLSHDWIRCGWQELKETNGLRVFVVLDQGRPILIAPLMRSRAMQKRLPVNVLGFIEHPESQIADMIVAAPDIAENAVAVLLNYITQKHSSEWHLLSLDKIPNNSPIAGCLRAQQSFGGCAELRPSHEALVISLASTWPEYLNSRSVRFRKTLRNVANRVRRLGRVEIKHYRGQAAASDAIRKLFSVSNASWKVSNGIAITSTTGRMRFFEELAHEPLTGEGLRIVLLEVNGAAIASETQIVDRGVVYALRSDYDERYADSSPGTYLQAEILKELFEEGRQQEYNFGIGLNPYKMRWTEQKSQLVNFRAYSATLYGRLLRSVDGYSMPKLAHIPGLRLWNGSSPEKS